VALNVEVTRDALLGGRVRYTQPARGYRVAVEAPLLARFAIGDRARPFERVVDLGAGPGAIGLMLGVTGWGSHVVAIEGDATHAALAADNAHDNGLDGRFGVLHASIEDDAALQRAGAAVLVVSNPPWFEPDRGPIARGERRANARALCTTSLDAFVRAARRLLGRGGRFVVSFPASRFEELLVALSSVRLVAKRARFVHARAGREAQVVFVEAKPSRAGGLVLEAPLFVRGSGEDYEQATRDALRGEWPVPRESIATSSGRAGAAETSSGSSGSAPPDPA
jgi:tRNA1Val (adenine37-N6)-methyltransferase